MAREKRRVVVVVRDGATVRVKECHGCGLRGVCGDGEESDFHPVRFDDGRAINWQPLCRACQSVAKAIERVRDPARHRAMDARLREARREDLEWLARYREYRRGWQARRYREDPDFIEQRRLSNRTYRDRVRGGPPKPQAPRRRRRAPPVVPSAPFLAWWRASGGVLGETENMVAERLGASLRVLHRLRAGESRFIAVGVVDRALLLAPGVAVPELGLGAVWSFDDLYPEASFPHLSLPVRRASLAYSGAT